MLPGEEDKVYDVIFNNLGDMDHVRCILDEWTLAKSFNNTKLNILGICTRHDWCLWMKEYTGNNPSTEEIKETREFLRSYGVYVTLLFDRDDIKEEELHDEYSNYLIRLLSKWHTIYWYKNKKPLKFYLRRHFKKPRAFESVRPIPKMSIIVFNEDRSVRWVFDDDISKMNFKEIEELIEKKVKECTYIPKKKRTIKPYYD